MASCPICGTHGVPCDCGAPDVDSDDADLEILHPVAHNQAMGGPRRPT